jgi:hypothetical protein
MGGEFPMHLSPRCGAKTGEGLMRAQTAAAGAAQASQLALFATLHNDRRPPPERTASGRYLQPGLFEN